MVNHLANDCVLNEKRNSGDGPDLGPTPCHSSLITSPPHWNHQSSFFDIISTEFTFLIGAATSSLRPHHLQTQVAS